MKNQILLTVPAACVLLLAAGVFQKSSKLDFKTAMERAGKAYEAKGYGECTKNLRAALQVVTTYRTDAIRAALPAAPAGLKIDDPKNNDGAAGLMFMGVGTEIARRYHEDSGEKSIDLKVQADSAFVQAMLPMFSNPIILQSMPNAEMLEYGKHKAVLTKEDEKRWKLQIVIEGLHLIDVQAQGIDKDTLLKLLDDNAVEKIAKELLN